MFTGRWIFLALASLSGLILTLELHVFSVLLILMFIIRVVLEKNIRLLLACCICLLIFSSISFLKEKNNLSIYNLGDMTAIITFQQYPLIDGDRLRAVVVTEHEKLQLQYRIQTEHEKEFLKTSIQAGTVCKISGELLEPMNNTNEHAFNYAKYLKRHDIHWIFQPSNNMLQNCTSSKKSLSSYFINIREQGIRLVEENFPTTILPYVNALVFGERSFFDEDLLNAYQRLGVIHLLAISGLHVGFIMGFLYYFFRRIGLTKEVTYWIFVATLPMYAMITGANPPVVRAILMMLLLLTSKKWQWPLTPMDTIAISFILFILFNPYIVYQAGFQLSFVVSMGLVIMANSLPKETSFLKTLFETSLTSMLVSLPILMWHFYEFSLVSLVANIFFVPFYSLVVLPSSIFAWVVQFVNDEIFLYFTDLLAKVLIFSEHIVMYVSSWHFSSVITGKPSGTALFCIIIGIGIYFLLREKKKLRLVAVFPLLFIFIIYFVGLHYSPKGEVVFIDVGQGDSIFIQLPYNRGNYLIDTGGQIDFPQEEWKERATPFDVGKSILIPFIKSKGVQKIDKLILTHADIDHMGAGEELLKQIKIKEVHVPPNSWEKPMMEAFLTKAEEKDVKIAVTKAGSKWQNKSGSFSFIYPIKEEYLDNDSSLVLLADFGGMKWLFTGDLEKEGERELLQTYGKLSTDVLKVGHHGSKTSTSIELLERIKPEYAVISAGKNNRYGHPHPDVLENLQRFKVKIFRIDEHGALHYKFSSEGGTFQTISQ
ncbi:DNA internalization-related competence protein ComEC/Rec2 [Bacillus sp. SD088]|uniref:DNA internalization-related competence protein ComEC/Rec2 n=1 Tax=Bacillus sp. SD088 TaxID=2782012 RepID=UPI0024182F66|nr:DNA internalization-related competence protein ComEC/Rec2 [Bacillus sp. SD088]